MYKGLIGVLTLQDLPRLEGRFATARLLDAFRKESRKPTRDANLFKTLLRSHWRLWLAPFPTRVAQAAFEFTQPFLISRTLHWLYVPAADSNAVGWGLLGAYAIVYIGIAVSLLDREFPFTDHV